MKKFISIFSRKQRTKKSSFTIGWEFIHKPTTLTTSVAATSIAYMNKKSIFAWEIGSKTNSGKYMGVKTKIF